MFILFLRVQCRSGMCTTPIHVTASQLISSEVFPLPVVKALLYPGAIVNSLTTDMTFPSWNNLLSIYNLTDIKEASAEVDLQRLEVCVGALLPHLFSSTLNNQAYSRLFYYMLHSFKTFLLSFPVY